jgi:GT2 family glycosyltransferase
VGYRLLEVDLAEPLPDLRLDVADTGYGVLVRRAGRPLGFVLERALPGTEVAPDELGRRITEHLGADVVRDALREQRPRPREGDHLTSITAAVCTRDRPEQLARCLDSLRSVRARAADLGATFDILVVDNASLDERTRRVALSAEVEYLAEPRPGLDFARNCAWRAASGEWIAYFDDDVVVDEGWVEGLLDVVASHRAAAVITGQVLPLALETDAQVVFERHGGFRNGWERVRYGRTLPGWATYPAGAWWFGTGANMAFRTDVLDALGGFDEALDTGPPLPGGGDVDLFYRAVRAGYGVVYEPRCLVLHEHRREWSALRRQYRLCWGQASMALTSKALASDPEMRPQLRSHVVRWFLATARELLRSAVGRSARPPDLVLAELVGAVVGLTGAYPRSVRRSRGISCRVR